MATEVESQAAPARQGSSWWTRALLVAGMLGPGLVTASAGNDVGGILTYSLAGAQFGYKILWTLIPLTVGLIVVQEMAARMGAVTGKGLAALVRENFGVRISFLAMIALFVTNTAITATEFAGIATASEIFHLSRWIAVPVSLVAVFLFVLRFNGKIVERVFVAFSLVYLAYIVSAVLAHPNWHQVAHDVVVPNLDFKDRAYVLAIVGIIGTTISPYMQFFLQSQIVEKGARVRDLFATRLDVISGSAVAILIAGFMIVATSATVYIQNQHLDAKHQITFVQAADAAIALRPLAGEFASVLFAIGILNAGLFTATVLPLATSFVICEAFGFEASVERRFSEAPVFFSLFAVGLIAGAGLVLIPGLPYLQFTFWAQVIQGMLLPLELVLMLIIVNRSRVMGAYVNGRASNIIAWATAIIIGAVAIYYTAIQILSGGS